MSRKEEFVKKANLKHNNKYTYFEYKNAKEKIKIVCPTHGEFYQTPGDHLKGRGCPECGKERIREKLTNKEKEKSNLELLSEKDANDIVKIKCLDCGGVFEKTYYNYKRTKICPICKPKKAHIKKTTEQFIKEAKEIHDYDYSLVNYINNKTKIKIICNKHGAFEQTPKDHLKGQGCPYCKGGKKDTKEEFIKKAKEVFGDFYDYSLVNYVNTSVPVKLKCLKCNRIIERPPNAFLQGRGCSHGKKSFGEEIITQILEEKEIEFKREYIFEEISPLRFDFYIPEKNTVIEFQGLQHYEPREIWGGEEYLKKLQANDKRKKEFCKKNGIRLLEIPYTELRNLNNILLKL